MSPHHILRTLEAGRKVAVVTMQGSCCPVTLAHSQMFVEARSILLNRGFDAILGALSVNSNNFLSEELGHQGLPLISKAYRARLVELATQEYDWLEYNGHGQNQYFQNCEKNMGHLRFCHYLLSDTDDMVRRKKWKWTGVRQIVMCRPGSTDELMSELCRDSVDTTNGTFIVGPELPDISPAAVREAFAQGDCARLMAFLHPDVARWCWEQGPYRPPADAVWDATVMRAPTPASVIPAELAPEVEQEPLSSTGSLTVAPQRRVVLVGIGGASGCGKTTLGKTLAERLRSPLQAISADLYNSCSRKDPKWGRDCEQPAGIDVRLLRDDIRSVSRCLATTQRLPRELCVGRRRTNVLNKSAVLQGDIVFVVVEGFLLFYDPEFAVMCDVKLWLEAEHETCMKRRYDRHSQKKSAEEFRNWYSGLVWASYLKHRDVQLANACDALQLRGEDRANVILADAEAHCRATSCRRAEEIPNNDATRSEAAKRLFKIVSGVLNKSCDEAEIAESASDIVLWSSEALSFATACDALSGAMEEGLLPLQDIALLVQLASRLPDNGVPHSAKLAQSLDRVDRGSGDNAMAESQAQSGGMEVQRSRRWGKPACTYTVPAVASFTTMVSSTCAVTLQEVERLCGVGTAGETRERQQKTLAVHGAKAKRAALARETLNVLASGSYVAPGLSKPVDISSSLCKAVAASTHVPATTWRAPSVVATKQRLSVEVRCCTVLAAAQEIAVSTAAVPGVLNFASARNPGGGFTTGAEAQEESLARSSGIYPCLSKHFDVFFAPSRQAASGLYTHDLIHSPAVPVLRDEHGTFLDTPYHADFVSAAAPNCGVLRKRSGAREAARECREALGERIRRVLHTFASNGCVDLVLGAWGCGVFGNDPATVAELFGCGLAEFRCFRTVIFAVLDPRMAEIFGRELKVRVKGL